MNLDSSDKLIVGAGSKPALVNRSHRKSMRLKNYDYTSAGAYFMTICTHDRKCLFGHIDNGKMVLNSYGDIVRNVWGDLINHMGGIRLEVFVVMPNHMHGIVMIKRAGLEPAPTKNAEAVGAGSKPALSQCGLSEIVRQFKTFSAKRINALRQTAGAPVWQRNYYEHVIRDEKTLFEIREYIENNPKQWDLDENNPANLKM